MRVSTMESVLALLAFFDEVGADLDTYTQMVRLRPMDVRSGEEFRQWIQRAGPGWSGMTYRSSDGSMKAIALPVEDVGPDTTSLLPFVEVHQAMVVWWLTTVWRARQLLLAAEWAWSNDLIVPAAASARGLAETAAQFHADALKVASRWDALKTATTLTDTQSGFGERVELLETLMSSVWGGRFDDKAPAWQGTMFGQLSRTNVLSAVDKLARPLGPTWQEDFQLLCNVVHPSVGNFLGFALPIVEHESSSHILLGVSGKSTAIETSEGPQHQVAVPLAVGRTIARSSHVLLVAVRDALRVLDDVALTTRAGKLSVHTYWRAIRVADRQALCPCRSGERAYRCRHAFGEPGPTITPVATPSPAATTSTST